MSLNLPPDYRPILDLTTTLTAIRFVNETFRNALSESLDLLPVPAQLFLPVEAGLNDDLGAGYRVVSFPIDSMNGRKAEIVRSLSKWKRLKLMQYGIPEGRGICAEVKAIRVDDVSDCIHSTFVDQWDWEQTISSGNRTFSFLKETVRKIYAAMKETERSVCDAIPEIEPVLPNEIVFVHAEELLREFPELSPVQREYRITERHGAVFLIGIGCVLSDGRKHGERDPDCDDWSTPCGNGFFGLNGDILVWNPVLQDCLELSSMGIRVDRETMLRQLSLCGLERLAAFPFHQLVLDGTLPLSIGGGVGQSRLNMFMLRKAMIGEVLPAVWPDEILRECEQARIPLL